MPATRIANTASIEQNDLSRNRMMRALSFVREHGPAEVIRQMRSCGLRGSLAFATRNIRHIIADRIARRWDRMHNVNTAGSIPLKFLDVIGPNRDFGNECVCTSPRSFDFVMRHLPEDLGRYTFVDIGAGKSRTLLLASRYGFGKVTGVEFARELVAISRDNIAKFRHPEQKCSDVMIEAGDAAEYDFPDDPLVIYFYNPFSPDVFDTVLNNLIATLTTSRQECYLIYASSSNNTIDWAKPAIASTGYFTEMPVAPMPFFWDAVRTLKYAVYRAR